MVRCGMAAGVLAGRDSPPDSINAWVEYVVDTPLLWGAVVFRGMRNSFRVAWRDELERI